MTWHALARGPHSGKTLPEVLFEDPAYVLFGIEAGEFQGALLTEAIELRHRAARIRVPRDAAEEQRVVVAFYLLPDRSFGGFTILAESDPRLPDYRRFSAAVSAALDLTMPGRIAPGDPAATTCMLHALLFHLFGDPHRRLTADECIAFFENPANLVETDRHGPGLEPL